MLHLQVIVVVERLNWLARDVSALEMTIHAYLRHGIDVRRNCHHPMWRDAVCPGNCINTFREYDHLIHEGTAMDRKW